jgi:hypothetical protein
LRCFRFERRASRCAVALAAVGLGAGAVLTPGVAAAATPALASAFAASAAPAPTGEFTAVSCTSHSACTGVGAANNSNGVAVTLAERWNGRAWAIEHTPSPLLAFLRGVSCSSVSACIAVGYYYPTTTPIPKLLAERWNGTSWAIQVIPTPAGTTESDLESVSCTSASACTAVGTYLASTPVKVLAERWNGKSWAVQTTPNPTTTGASSLFGVSCRSARSCTAVGSDGTALLSVPLAEHWNGKSWAIQTTPNPKAGHTVLTGVSCLSATSCTAVGNYQLFDSGATKTYATLAEHWNGKSWAIQTTPNPNPDGGKQHEQDDLVGVSCVSAKSCTAAGFYYGALGALTLAEHWNGTSWTVQSTPNPNTTGGSNFAGVSCVSGKSCTAVGNYGNVLTLAERWNGTAWAIQASPNPGVAREAQE